MQLECDHTGLVWHLNALYSPLQWPHCGRCCAGRCSITVVQMTNYRNQHKGEGWHYDPAVALSLEMAYVMEAS